MPWRYLFDPENSRWSLGSYDICFKNGERSLLSAFFSYGNTLPMHRGAYSKHGGLFQATMTQAIKLLSDPHAPKAIPPSGPVASEPVRDNSLSPANLPISDPFSSSALTYTTTGLDSFPVPSYYTSRRFNWVHIFPEGKTHQHPDKFMRYFKWGVARLILESDPCPDVLAIWIDGPQEVMSEDRTWPRPMPRAGKHIAVTFGECVDTESLFGEYRRRWQALKEEAARRRLQQSSSGSAGAPHVEEEEIGVLRDDFLRYSPEAEQLRVEVTLAVRKEVLKVRRSTGLSDEDPKAGLAETWREEGSRNRREGHMEDGSIVKDT
ncbi:hypothetical protein K431DRAFT_294076 [Polychaeton citri CBS 116435]|uniref:Tafazzin family protein n=1 Tax=Polychaeton citri CBS 116435 TaxID=1314669 RepID=A0A9P4UQC9_9PEZI|nr:hypothetical protein K431DRAFT_294076 [Polychaeton citri CBS 116435]